MEKLKTVFNDELDYHPFYKLESASLIQLLTFYEHRLLLLEPDENIRWQQLAYPQLKSIFKDLNKKLNNKINELVKENLDLDVIKITLSGYDYKLPVKINLQKVKNKRYQNANAGDILRHIDQRLTYIINCQTPSRYDDKQKLTYEKVQMICKEFSNDLNLAKNKWKQVCQDALYYARN
jgi:hypothetical protein